MAGSDSTPAARFPGGFLKAGITLRDGRVVTIRSIREEDADALRAAFSGLSREARHARFMAPLERLTPAMLDRAVHPGERELVLVAVAREGAAEIIVAGARHAGTASAGVCEFAVTVGDNWQGVGLASRMMEELIGDAAARGLARMEGYVLATNRAMLGLARRLGFEEGPSDEGPAVRLVRLDLARAVRPDRGQWLRDAR